MKSLYVVVFAATGIAYCVVQPGDPSREDEADILSAQYRISSFALLRPEAKSQLLRTQFEHYRQRHLRMLSEEQKETLDCDFELMSPNAYASFDGNEANGWDSREAPIEASGVKEARALFARLGPDSAATDSAVDGVGPAVDDTPAFNFYVPYCTCHTIDDWCMSGNCKAGVIKCLVVSGCGWGWQKLCTGLCL